MLPPAPPPESPIATAQRRRLFNLAAIGRDAWQTNWSMTNARAGLLCLPVIAAWIFLGLIHGEHAWTLRAVAGAVAVGFGAFQHFGTRQLWPMFATLVGMTVATWIGSVAGHLGVAWLVVAASLGALLFGAMTTLGYATWWIGLQWMIALLVYGAQAYGPREALKAALGVLGGGATQLIVLSALLPLTDAWFRRQTQPPLDPSDLAFFRRLARSADPFNRAGRHALRVAIAVGLGVFVSHRWSFANSYWMPMTAAILLKPDLHETTVRGLNRLAGTLLGVGLTTLLIALARPNDATLGVLLLCAIYGCFILQRVHYAFFATCITMYVVLLLSLVGLPEPEVALHRVAATLIGAAIALLVHRIPLHQADATVASRR